MDVIANYRQSIGHLDSVKARGGMELARDRAMIGGKLERVVR